jgi:alkylation response protein AidB-like acyl-CoA dehydrogenase
MKCRGDGRRRHVDPQRPEGVDHQCRCVAVLHGAGRHRPRRPPRRQRHRLRRREVRPGLHLRREGAQARDQGQSPTRELHFDNCVIPGDRMVGGRGEGSRSPCAPSTTPASRSVPRPSASPRARSTWPRPTSRNASSSASTSRSSRGAVHARRHGDGARGGAAVGLCRRGQVRAQRRRPVRSSARRPSASPSDVAMKVTTDAVQLLGGAGYVTRTSPSSG